MPGISRSARSIPKGPARGKHFWQIPIPAIASCIWIDGFKILTRKDTTGSKKL